MNQCPRHDCPLRAQCAAKVPAAKPASSAKDSLPQDQTEKRKQGVERVPAGGGFRVVRRMRLPDGD